MLVDNYQHVIIQRKMEAQKRQLRDENLVEETSENRTVIEEWKGPVEVICSNLLLKAGLISCTFQSPGFFVRSLGIMILNAN